MDGSPKSLSFGSLALLLVCIEMKGKNNKVEKHDKHAKENKYGNKNVCFYI